MLDKNKLLFWKKNTISQKLLVPFLLITAFLAIFSMLLSVHFISQALDKRLHQELETQNLLLKDHLKDSVGKLIFHTNLLSDMRESLLNIQSSKKIKEAKDLFTEIFQESGTNIFWSWEDIPVGKRTKYQEVFKHSKLTKIQHKVLILERSKNELVLSILGYSKDTHKKFNNSFITEIIFDNNFLTETMKTNDKAEAAFIYLKAPGTENLFTLAATEYIAGEPLIQQALFEKLLKNTPHKFHRTYANLKYNGTRYKVISDA
ncbi:hypothetical protein ACFLZV_06180 [Candidatus Margulisiibacteriota bacterium]